MRGEREAHLNKEMPIEKLFAHFAKKLCALCGFKI